MSLKYFFGLYRRNVKGTITGPDWLNKTAPEKGYLTPEYFIKGLPGAVFILLHIVALPVSLTLGAGIKTLIDYFSRKSVSSTVITDVNNQIQNINQESFSNLETELRQYNPKSNSSKRALALLSQIDSDRNSCAFSSENDAETALCPEQLEPATETNVQQSPEQTLNRKKAVISDFLVEEMNNGKKLHQIICRFFQPKPAESSTDSVLTTPFLVKG